MNDNTLTVLKLVTGEEVFLKDATHDLHQKTVQGNYPCKLAQGQSGPQLTFYVDPTAFLDEAVFNSHAVIMHYQIEDEKLSEGIVRLKEMAEQLKSKLILPASKGLIK